MQRLVTYYARFLAALTPGTGEASESPRGVSNTRAKWLLTAIYLLISGGPAALAAETTTIKLGWNENPERNVTGYILMYGTDSGRYTSKIATSENWAKVPGIEEGKTYYFVVLARNRAGLLSPRSREITYRLDTRVAEPPEGKITSPARPMVIYTGDQIEFQGDASDPNGKSPFKYSWNFGGASGIAGSTDKNPGFRQFDRAGNHLVTFTVTNSQGKADPTPSARLVIVKERPNFVLPSSNWKLKFVDSEEKLDAKGTFAFDGNPATFWHSRWRGKKPPKGPHEIQLDLGASGNVTGFRYLPRQDGITVGNIGKYEFYVSKDGRSWGKPVSAGTFDATSSEKQVMFTARTARYVKLRSLKAAGGESDCNVAELVVLTTPKPASIAAGTTSKAGKKKSAGVRAAETEVTPASTTSLPVTGTVVINGKKYRSLTLRKDSLPEGAKTVIQVSSNLLDWFSGKNHTTVVIDNAEVLKVRDNIPVSPDAKRFIRLKGANP